MRMKYLVAFLLVLVGHSSFAQKEVVYKSPSAFYIMPCQLLSGTYASGFTVGAEFRLTKRYSFSIEGGPFYEPGYMFKTDIKYYLNGHKDGHFAVKKYFGLEYAYKQQDYKVHDELTTPPKPGIDYSVYKFVNTGYLKYGMTISRPRSFYMDAYVGLGIRYRVVHNNLTAAQKDDLYHWHEGFVDSYTNGNARGFAPAISIGWKIGFRYK